MRIRRFFRKSPRTHAAHRQPQPAQRIVDESTTATVGAAETTAESADSKASPAGGFEP